MEYLPFPSKKPDSKKALNLKVLYNPGLHENYNDPIYNSDHIPDPSPIPCGIGLLAPNKQHS